MKKSRDQRKNKIRKSHIMSLVLLFSLTPLLGCLAQQTGNKSMEYYIKTAPFHMPRVTVPHFPDKTYNIEKYGAIGNGKNMNTKSIQKAIDVCSNSGGGTVLVPPGLWLTGPIELKSHVNFHLARGSILLFSKNHADFPIIKAAHSSHKYIVESPIYGHDLTDIAITGGGVIDGSGQTWRPVKRSKVTSGHWHELLASGGALSDNGRIWWPTKAAKNGKKYLESLRTKKGRLTAKDFLPARDYMRPYMFYIVYSKNILIDGPTFKNSPKFALMPKHCKNMIIRNIKVNNEYWAQNGDGLDVGSSKNVILYHNTVTAGDDGICLKSSPEHGNSGPSMKNVIIADNVVYHGHGGFVIGSNTNGGIENVYVTNNDYIGTDRGLRFKSRRGRGGLVHNIYVKNIYMSNIVDQAIYFNTYYELKGKNRKSQYHPVNSETPRFQNIHISNIYCDGANTAVSMTGLPEMPVQDITLSNIRIVARHGFSANDTKNIHLSNVKIIPQKGTVYTIKNSKNITMKDQGVPKHFNTYLNLIGSKTSGIVLKGTYINNPKEFIKMGPNVKKNALKISK